MLTKEECLKALDNLNYNIDFYYFDEDYTVDVRESNETLKQLIEEHFYNPPKIDGNTSDGYHTFNELYHHRAVLFSVICNQNKEIAWKSKQHHDGTMYDGMFIVGVDTPQGQYSYHYDIEPYWDMFNVKELDKAPLWDGHEPKDIDRLLTINDNPPLKFEELKGGMIIWDNATKEWKELFDWWDGWIRYYKFGCQFSDRLERLDNRYYRKQVNDDVD